MDSRSPRNLEELRQKYVEIIQMGYQKRFGVRSLKILKKMLDSPAEAAVKSISEIAAEHETNTSTVTRLAQRLGFKGFPGYQHIFRQHLKEGPHYYSAQVKTFLQSAHSRTESDDSTLQQVVHKEWGNVMATLESHNQNKFEEVVDLIIEAEHVCILGLRSVYSLAFYLAYYLSLIRNNVVALGKPGHSLAEDLAPLGRGDLLLAISVRPYTKDTVAACREVKRQGTDLVTITDTYSSPLAAETENTLIASGEGPYFFNPLTSAVIYVEALLSEVVKSLGNEAVMKLKRVEKLFERMEIEAEC
jgi:DNA-binding MurR/RpiR family transcriptional regulator